MTHEAGCNIPNPGVVALLLLLPRRFCYRHLISKQLYGARLFSPCFHESSLGVFDWLAEASKQFRQKLFLYSTDAIIRYLPFLKEMEGREKKNKCLLRLFSFQTSRIRNRRVGGRHTHRGAVCKRPWPYKERPWLHRKHLGWVPVSLSLFFFSSRASVTTFPFFFLSCTHFYSLLSFSLFHQSLCAFNSPSPHGQTSSR